MISCVYLPLLFFGRGIGFAEDWALRNSKSFAGEAHGVFFRKCVKKRKRRPLYSATIISDYTT